MGFLDKLLGRSKDAAQDAGDAAKDVGGKVGDTADDAGDKAKDTFDGAKSHVAGESDTSQSEDRLDDVGGQVAKDEGRTP